MPSIKLQSSDGEIFEVDVEIAKQSVTIKTMLEDLGMDDEGDDDPVPLPNVNAAILKKVIQWCTHHKDDPPPPEDDENKEKRTDDIPVWDQEFLKVDQGTLFELILAANLRRRGARCRPRTAESASRPGQGRAASRRSPEES
ncbi:S-phase kinase-associated protein 1-like [Microtus ochrogaster]|uniref:S-phase kinase-associated protein 1-like n=1 Tax=Microtus ochrogaster TaxID=79684 RepID=A0ABM1AIJ2_MICOH|nr:S-phase kinase-associated protein 1-like [Microtus ochrogaster]